MASLTATISFQTASLFPNPINFTVSRVESVNLDAAFSTVTIPAGGSATIYGPTTAAVGTSEVVYLYVQSIATNDPTDEVLVIFTDSAANTAAIGKLIPGDFLWMPIRADLSGVGIEIDNSAAATEDKTFNFLFAERG
jgi:hypothetical protein